MQSRQNTFPGFHGELESFTYCPLVSIVSLEFDSHIPFSTILDSLLYLVKKDKIQCEQGLKPRCYKQHSY